MDVAKADGRHTPTVGTAMILPRARLQATCSALPTNALVPLARLQSFPRSSGCVGVRPCPLACIDQGGVPTHTVPPLPCRALRPQHTVRLVHLLRRGSCLCTQAGRDDPRSTGNAALDGEQLANVFMCTVLLALCTLFCSIVLPHMRLCCAVLVILRNSRSVAVDANPMCALTLHPHRRACCRAWLCGLCSGTGP